MQNMKYKISERSSVTEKMIVGLNSGGTFFGFPLRDEKPNLALNLPASPKRYLRPGWSNRTTLSPTNRKIVGSNPANPSWIYF